MRAHRTDVWHAVPLPLLTHEAGRSTSWLATEIIDAGGVVRANIAAQSSCVVSMNRAQRLAVPHVLEKFEPDTCLQQRHASNGGRSSQSKIFWRLRDCSARTFENSSKYHLATLASALYTL
jgi:hypothetical protein